MRCISRNRGLHALVRGELDETMLFLSEQLHDHALAALVLNLEHHAVGARSDRLLARDNGVGAEANATGDAVLLALQGQATGFSPRFRDKPLPPCSLCSPGARSHPNLALRDGGSRRHAAAASASRFSRRPPP